MSAQMADFDQIASDVAGKSGLGRSAAPFVKEVLNLVTRSPGGVEGFLTKLKSAGLGTEVTSWLRGAGPRSLSPQRVEAVLGAQTIGGIADRVGIPTEQASATIGQILPYAIGVLATNGHSIPESAGATRANNLLAMPDHQKHLWRWGALLLLCIGLGALVWQFFTPRRLDEATLPTAPTGSLPTPAMAQPRLLITTENGIVTYSGTVGDNATRAAILEALRSTFGEDKVRGAIGLASNVAPAPWVGHLGAGLEKLRANGVSALFEGNKVSVGGLATDEAQADLARTLPPALGTAITVGRLSERMTEMAANANQQAMAALSALKPNYTAKDLTGAFNNAVINFGNNSAELPAVSSALLHSTALMLKSLPAGTVIEIAGYTDSTGDAAANLAMSQQRADAVRNRLVTEGVDPGMLVAKGYGSADPVAANDTIDGRLRNRRIAFRVIAGG